MENQEGGPSLPFFIGCLFTFLLVVFVWTPDFVVALTDEVSFTRVENSRVEDRPQEKIKRKILADLPEYQQTSNDFKRVNLLRSWAAHVIRVGSPSCQFGKNSRSTSNFDFVEADVWSQFEAFRNNRGAVHCGMAGDFLQNVYQAFGWTSLKLDVGTPQGNPTHLFNAVPIQRNGQIIYSIQDAHFNLTFTFPDGRLLGYFELIERLHKRKTNEIRLVWNSEFERFHLRKHTDGTCVARRQTMFDPSVWIQRQPNYHSFLRQHGLPDHHLYFYLTLQGIYGPSRGRLLRFYRHVKDSNVIVTGDPLYVALN